MGIIREPKHIDLSTKSEPWNAEELADFRKIMQEIKQRNKRPKANYPKTKPKKLR
jgi:hypothetical protein